MVALTCVPDICEPRISSVEVCALLTSVDSVRLAPSWTAVHRNVYWSEADTGRTEDRGIGR